MSSLRNIHAELTNKPFAPFSETFTLNGDEVTENAIGDYSAAPVDFYVAPPVGVIWEMSVIKLEIGDNGAIAHDNYGGIPALINGIQFFSEKGGVRTVTTVPPIKSNSRLITASTHLEVLPFDGGVESLIFEFDFSSFADSILLNGDTDDKYGVILNDNFSTLVAHHFSVLASTQGVRSVPQE